MASYMVVEPPGRDAQEKAILIRDGFHFWAFLLPPVWFLWHRMWREAAIVVAASVALSLVLSLVGYPNLAGWASLLIGLYVGLEASALRLAALERADWRLCGVVEAGTLAEAEIRYLADQSSPPEGPPAPTVLAPWTRPSPHAPRSGGPALGLFGYPGSR